MNAHGVTKTLCPQLPHSGPTTNARWHHHVVDPHYFFPYTHCMHDAHCWMVVVSLYDPHLAWAALWTQNANASSTGILWITLSIIKYATGRIGISETPTSQLLCSVDLFQLPLFLTMAYVHPAQLMMNSSGAGSYEVSKLCTFFPFPLAFLCRY